MSVEKTVVDRLYRPELAELMKDPCAIKLDPNTFPVKMGLRAEMITNPFTIWVPKEYMKGEADGKAK